MSSPGGERTLSQPERLARLRAALARADPPRIHRADAVTGAEVTARRSGRGASAHRLLAVAWQHLGKPRAEGGRRSSRRRARVRGPEAPLAWVRFEEDERSPGAGLTLDLWDGRGPRQRVAMGRGDFDGR